MDRNIKLSARIFNLSFRQSTDLMPFEGKVIIFCFDGSGWLTGNHDIHGFARGDAVCLNAAIPVELTGAESGGTSCGVIQIPAELCERMPPHCRLPQTIGKISLVDNDFETEKACFMILLKQTNSNRLYSMEICEYILWSLLLCISRQFDASGNNACTQTASPRSRGLAEQARQAIIQRFEEHLPLTELAGHYGVSAPYLSATIRKYTGVTFSSYLNSVRVERAKMLLADTDELVIDIAVATGFGSSSYFNRTFRKYTSLTPLQYRKQYRTESGECRKFF